VRVGVGDVGDGVTCEAGADATCAEIALATEFLGFVAAS
jgi:hypothetical protein